MNRLVFALGLVALMASADAPSKVISYTRFRYTGFGIADSARDKKIVDDFTALVGSKPSGEVVPVMTLTPEERAARIAALETELASPLASGAGRAEVLRRSARTSELTRLKYVPGPAPAPAARPTGQNVIALVDSMPNSISVRDGRIASQDAAVEILGHFVVTTQWAEQEAALLVELKLLADIAGGNVLLVSYAHDKEPQGQCRGAVGIIVRDPDFDPKKVSRGRLPSEI